MQDLMDRFKIEFGEGGEVATFFAPGRVNLIGEHTDYNGGHVFPCALSVGTYAAARKRSDDKVRFYSMNFPESGVIETTKNDLKFEKAHDWANYPKGVIDIFQKEGVDIPYGMDIAYYGNIPNGAGLSSSASIELVTGVLLDEIFELSMDRVRMVQLCQKAENEFVGVNCGIMDQFAIGMAEKDYALLLNCDTLDYIQTPMQLKDHTLIIANTNKRRGLADSKYNERRSECESALKDLQKHLDIESLGDLTEETFEEYKSVIQGTVVQKRAAHAVLENRRTIKAVDKLNQGDIEGFGKLMNDSHVSLRDDYEVTGFELDTLVEAAWNNGSTGSRMTGAGFGGCTINIVPQQEVDNFIETVGRTYHEKTGIEAEFYVVEVGDGAKKLEEGVTL
ncbi:galactokinase [Halobacillus yeomjeoni]|uniref:Galactokinase n=1 Tax=Halobacillus yeomjeoni TaxID=311194 RepID=A0A931MVC1_9BACI|nr:galactokinase [Halobacillus yeomjeoni]MBH0230652.1 galactokinase [Halobacillus yeomjeoni]